MDSKKLLTSVFCLLIFTTGLKVQAKSTGYTNFEEYLRAMNSSTTIPNVEERMQTESYILAYLNYSYTDSEGVTVEFSEENARYGEGQVLNVTGLLVHVSSRNDVKNDRACNEDILGTQGNEIPVNLPWIALVQRGNCNFEEKVKHVAMRGAVGVIIYNDKPVMNLEKMQIKDKNRNITAVMTFRETGQDMANILDQGFDVMASISRGRSGIRPINVLNRTSVLFVSISFIVLMIISLVWLIFYYIQRFRYLQSKDQQSRHLCSVTKRAIMKIPTKTIKGNDKDGDNDCCPICIEAYKSSDCIRILPCNHEFHKNCIDPWLIEHRTCPMCKLDVLKYYGYVVGEPSASLSSPNEQIISANDHIVINPSSMNISRTADNEIGINITSSSDGSTYNTENNTVNLTIGQTIPTTTGATPESDNRVSRHLCSVTKGAIIQISSKPIKGNDKDGDNDCCPKCNKAYNSSDCIRMLPCNHEFHKNCIDPWLIEHRTCPMCKLDVIKYYVVAEPSASLSSPNEQIFSANDQIVINPSSTNNSPNVDTNITINITSSNDGSTYSTVTNEVNLTIGQTIPTTTGATPESDKRVSVRNTTDRRSETITTSTYSRQVTDV